MNRVRMKFRVPAYLCCLFKENIRTPSIRCRDYCYLVPKVRGKFGQMWFAYNGAVAWNKMPSFAKDEPSEEMFKKNLKTYLCSFAF